MPSAITDMGSKQDWFVHHVCDCISFMLPQCGAIFPQRCATWRAPFPPRGSPLRTVLSFAILPTITISSTIAAARQAIRQNEKRLRTPDSIYLTLLYLSFLFSCLALVGKLKLTPGCHLWSFPSKPWLEMEASHV